MDFYLKEFLSEINNKKYKITIGTKNIKYSNFIKDDSRYKELYNWFFDKYKKEGYGIKSLIKDFNLPMSYSSTRNFIIFMGIELHTPNKANDFLKQRRSLNAKEQLKNKSGMYSNLIHRSNKITRGIQGYYWNESKHKYVWLRSSWEFIYAKWLNKQKIEWDVEVKQFKINEKQNYLPDFFIFENGKVTKIIEVKGYWKDKLYKFNKLKDTLTDTELVLITDITPYLEQSIKKEIKTWKNLRKLELKK